MKSPTHNKLLATKYLIHKRICINNTLILSILDHTPFIDDLAD